MNLLVGVLVSPNLSEARVWFGREETRVCGHVMKWSENGLIHRSPGSKKKRTGPPFW